MKCKFYKGPYHGKVKEINDNDFMSGRLVFNELSRRRRDRIDINSSAVYGVAVPYVTHTYEIVMMSGKIAGRQYHGVPAIHPDGSVFLVYKETKK